MDAMSKVVGKDHTKYLKPGMGSEDFSRYGEVVPAVFFRLGTGCKEKGITVAGHHSDFQIDESALIYGVNSFVQFVLDHQGGIDKEKMENADERRK
jgi:metal-dependent amidase/aminoacylase/carboxypeptidase family protein